MSIDSEISVVVVRELFRKPAEDDRPDWIKCLARCEGSEIAITGCDLDFIRANTYRLTGTWKTWNGDRQFAFTSAIRARPVDREAVQRYLELHGKGLGIGRAKSAKLWEKYGSKAIDYCKLAGRSQPDTGGSHTISILLKIPQEKSIEFAERLIDHEHQERCRVELTNLVSGRGFPRRIIDQAIAAAGAAAYDNAARNPYWLMRFSGGGFRRCDQLWLNLGKDVSDPKRIAYAVYWAISEYANGSTWITEDLARRHAAQYVAGAAQYVAGAEHDFDKALAQALRLGRMKPGSFGGLAETWSTADGGYLTSEGSKAWVGQANHSRDESRLGSLVAQAAQERPTYPIDTGQLDLSEHQRERLSVALSWQIGVLSGGPGTGKTYSVVQLVKQFGGRVVIGAPTGKAAVRLNQTLRDAGLEGIRAKTWHSLLGARGILDNGDWDFVHTAGNPLDANLLISDESSMNDSHLMAAVLAARPRGCRVLLVGDANQLPPVGAGAPFRDIIDSGIATGQLEEIQRNSGGIVEACDAIRRGRKWGAGDNLILREVTDPESVKSEIEWILEDESKKLINPKYDSQVITAMNSSGELSREKLNDRIRLQMNPEEGSGGYWKFRTGDKIICRRNQELPQLDDYGREIEGVKSYVANGDMALVHSLDTTTANVELMTSGIGVQIPLTNAKDWHLGYAITCHSSQGSEWPVVIVVLDRAGRRICDRSWLYTAISRAKARCYLVGSKRFADQICKSQKSLDRKTFLRQRINQERARAAIGDL